MAEYLDEIPAAKAVSLHDIYRVIAGHSYYHGDHILAALMCIAEGKEVNPVHPADVAPVVHGRWDDSGRYTFPSGNTAVKCTNCGCSLTESEYRLYDWSYCPICGAKMDGDSDNEDD